MAKKKKDNKQPKGPEQLSLFSGQIDLFSGSDATKPPTYYPPSPKEKAEALAPKVGKQYLDRFPYEVEKEILMQLIEEDAERWVAEIEWSKESNETPEDFFKRMGFE